MADSETKPAAGQKRTRRASSRKAAPKAEPKVETPDKPAEAAEPKAPHAVKATGPALVEHSPFHGGKSWVVRRGDVYSGAKAAFLWEHHRDGVKSYPS